MARCRELFTCGENQFTRRDIFSLPSVIKLFHFTRGPSENVDHLEVFCEGMGIENFNFYSILA